MITKAYAAKTATSEMAPWSLERREPRPDDVAIDILYCGVCHSDLHMVENDWGGTKYPIVPGHEIVGRVTAVGNEVTKFKVGDLVGVGCMVDSCRTCSSCEQGLEQYCETGSVVTYNGIDRHNGTITYGGYSEYIVVSDHFVVKIPDGMEPAVAAPLLCAGITTYSPLKHFMVGEGDKIGIIGMGGLGHIAIKLAKAMGAEVTVFTRSQDKVEEAKHHGADHVVISTDPFLMKSMDSKLHFILDTVPVDHDINPYVRTLKVDGTYIIVGQLTPLTEPLQPRFLIGKRRAIVGSVIGGMPETQEVLDFCAEHNIGCDIEMIKIEEINTAYERLKKSDVKYRFVIDMASLKE